MISFLPPMVTWGYILWSALGWERQRYNCPRNLYIFFRETAKRYYITHPKVLDKSSTKPWFHLFPPMILREMLGDAALTARKSYKFSGIILWILQCAPQRVLNESSNKPIFDHFSPSTWGWLKFSCDKNLFVPEGTKQIHLNKWPFGTSRIRPLVLNFR